MLIGFAEGAMDDTEDGLDDEYKLDGGLGTVDGRLL